MAEVPSVWTVLSMLEWATEYFEEREVRSPRLSIEWLLAHTLSIKRLDLYLEFDRPLSSEELDQLRPMVKRRGNHEPLQYITGETDFHQVKIKVRPGVLIPRQETEQMVDWILQEYPMDSALKVWDIGTGSGCIPIALKNARPHWEIVATDLSTEALSVARENAAFNEVDVDFKQDDLFQPTAYQGSKFDLIVSNPPYILPDEKDTLDREVKDFEPELALYCESTEKMYAAIEQICRQYLTEEGTAFLECHRDYAGPAKELFSKEKWVVQLKNDLSENPRFLRLKKA